jgi:tol-pal system protein YbgF
MPQSVDRGGGRECRDEALVTMRRLVTRAALVGALQLVLVGAGAAQDRDVRPLLDRIDRLERDMNQIQRQVYRGSSNGAPVPVSPADGSTAVNTELRMDQLETQMRTLTGTLEEATYSIDQLKQRLDKITSDTEMRLTALEHPGSPPPRGPVASNATPAPGAGANPAASPSQPGLLGAPSNTQTASRGSSAAAGQLPTGTAQEQYNKAYGLLGQADYSGAEQAFKSFLQRYPNDPLAGNAQYWLGETYYVRQDYNNAAASFAEGYRKYPQSGKGADSLLKLGMALGNVQQKKEACLTFNQLAKDFPNASKNIKDRAAQEKQRFSC